MSDPQFRTATARLLRVFLAAPATPRYGFELGIGAELPSGILYPLLAQLERARWIQGMWEPADPDVPARPPRRYYRLTIDGLDSAHEAFTAMDGRPTPPPVRAAEPPATGSARVVSLLPAAILLVARLRLTAQARYLLSGEWTAELHHVLQRGSGPAWRRLVRAVRFAAGLVAAAPRVARDVTPCRAAVPTDPLGVIAARRRLRTARRAWEAAAQRHRFIDPDLDPVGEALALHAALYCQLEMDEAQLSYGAACAIAAFEQGVVTG